MCIIFPLVLYTGVHGQYLQDLILFFVAVSNSMRNL